MFEARDEAPQSAAIERRPNAAAPLRGSMAGLLSPESILLDVDAATRERVFARAAAHFAARYGLREADVVAGLTEREALGSTALGQGVALPHARLKGVIRPVAAFLRLRLAIPFDAPDGKPVSSVLVLLVPESATDAHLVLLAEGAGMFCDKPLRDRLNGCATAEQVLAAFAGWRST